MTAKKKKLSKEERKRKARDEYWRKREMLQDEYERALREIEAEDEDD